MTTDSPTLTDWPVLSRYTRAAALADGVLRDAGSLAREAGFRFPVALTEAAWNAAVAPPGGAAQSQDGRLWDVLFLLRAASRGSGAVVRYQVQVASSEGSSLVQLKAVCGPGDQGEPVITVMLPDED